MVVYQPEWMHIGSRGDCHTPGPCSSTSTLTDDPWRGEERAAANKTLVDLPTKQNFPFKINHRPLAIVQHGKLSWGSTVLHNFHLKDVAGVADLLFFKQSKYFGQTKYLFWWIRLSSSIASSSFLRMTWLSLFTDSDLVHFDKYYFNCLLRLTAELVPPDLWSKICLAIKNLVVCIQHNLVRSGEISCTRYRGFGCRTYYVCSALTTFDLLSFGVESGP